MVENYLSKFLKAFLVALQVAASPTTQILSELVAETDLPCHPPVGLRAGGQEGYTDHGDKGSRHLWSLHNPCSGLKRIQLFPTPSGSTKRITNCVTKLPSVSSRVDRCIGLGVLVLVSKACSLLIHQHKVWWLLASSVFSSSTGTRAGCGAQLAS